jgi:hypothetical protein
MNVAETGVSHVGASATMPGSLRACSCPASPG